MTPFVKSMTYVVLWLITFAMWCAFLYGMLWLFSYESLFSWKISLGVMIVWIMIVRLFKSTGKEG